MLVALLAALATLIVGAVLGVVLFTREARPEPAVPVSAGGAPFDAQDAREQAFLEHQPAGGNTLVSFGIAAAILLPIIGLFIGIALLFKDRVGPGFGCILLSILMTVIYAALIAY